jgi:hypothetical protein
MIRRLPRNKNLTSDFAQLLKPTIETIDHFGLKSRHLRKHKKSVDRFFRKLSKTIFLTERGANGKNVLKRTASNYSRFLNIIMSLGITTMLNTPSNQLQNYVEG